MKTTALILLLSVGALAGDASWTQQSGRLAVFQAPPGMARDADRAGVDSIMENYLSRGLSITFDSEVRVVPPTLQGEFDRTVAAWAAQRKEDWRKSNNVERGGGIHGSDDPKDASGRRYYLYLGFAAGESGTVAVHVRFASLGRLDEVERLLRSIKFKAK